MADGDSESLAPVTPLFGGARGRAGGPAGAAGEGGSAGPAGPGGAASGEPAAAGASEAAPPIWGRSDDWAEPGVLGADETPAAPEQAATAAAPVAFLPRRDTELAEPAAELPTYGRFAATTEGDDARRPDEARSRVFGGGGDPTGDDGDEPEESLEAARLRAENISLHALGRRGVSSAEMAKLLRSRDLPEEVVLDEVARLEGVGLLNDTELAENLVRQKTERKRLGRSAVTAELRQRGLDQTAIESAVDAIDDDDEQARCDELALKRAGQLRGLDPVTAERRLSAFLMRRGYRSEAIRHAVSRALPRGGAREGGVRFE